MSNKDYKPTIGLEIHVELKTKTKMFCSSKNDPDDSRPNINICPICMAHPGTLPVINKEAVKAVLKVGIAVSGKLADFTEFDRKNYFYPDIPKGYQISQYKYPLVSGGKLNDVELTRIHLEEDTARSLHTKENYSLVDFNRAGVPLMELVTEPVINNGEEAMNFAKEFRLLMRYLRTSDADMEKGQMRVEANISVSDSDKLGTKVEVKNLNSLRSVGRAIDYEIKRQIEVLESRGDIVQETRGWDENKQQTFSQRKKESSQDYRYFPEPDLPKLKISEIKEFNKEKLQEEIPELPWEKRKRYKKEYEIKDEDIEVYVNNKKYAELFENTEGDKKLISNYITSDIVGLDTKLANLETKINSNNLSKLINMIGDGDLSSRGAKKILEIIYKSGGDPKEIANKENLIQKSNEDDLKPIIEKIVSENENVVKEYKKGKENSLKYLIGQGMKMTNGSANPKILEELIKAKL